MTLVAERAHKYGHSYVVRCACGKESFAMLPFRGVVALVAASRGHVYARWRRRNGWAAGFTDYHLEAACDLYGIGHGTLWDLQRVGLLAQVGDDEGPLRLTPLGDAVLAAIAALDGVTLPDLPAAA